MYNGEKKKAKESEKKCRHNKRTALALPLPLPLLRHCHCLCLHSTSAPAPPSSAHHLLGSVRLGLFLGRQRRRRWLEASAFVARIWGGANSGAPMGAVSQRMCVRVCVLLLWGFLYWVRTLVSSLVGWFWLTGHQFPGLPLSCPRIPRLAHEPLE